MTQSLERELPALEATDVRKAIAYARKHGKPLLKRVRTSGANKPVILAWDFADGTYQVAGGELEDGLVPRRVHLLWVRERLQHDDEPPEALSRSLGEDRAHALLGAEPLTEQLYAKAYGRGKTFSKRALTAWLDKTVDIYKLERDHDESLLDFLEANGPSSQVFGDLVSQMPTVAIWYDPDTGIEVGRVETGAGGPGYDVVTIASSAVAVSCLQLTSTMLGISANFEVRS